MDETLDGAWDGTSHGIPDGISAGPDCGGPENSPVRVYGDVQVVRTHHGVLIKAALQTELPVTCSRCLRELSHDSQLTIEEEGFELADVATGGPEDAPEDSEDSVPIDSRHMLDLSEVVRQYLLTDIPIKPLCQEECLGLCPDCGADLNEEKCNCDADPVDPRWGALAALRSSGRG